MSLNSNFFLLNLKTIPETTTQIIISTMSDKNEDGFLSSVFGLICAIAVPVIVFGFGYIVSVAVISILPFILIGIVVIVIIMFIISLFSKL